MTGLQLKLPGTFTDTALPKFRLDPVLPDTGALSLVEPAHPVAPWAAGLPASGSTVPNIVVAQAFAMGAVPSVTEPAGVLYSAPDASVKFERTTKGGIHVIASNTSPVANKGLAIYQRAALNQYLINNPGHSYFASFWGRLTRTALSTDPYAAFALTTPPSTSNLMFVLSRDGTNYPTTAARIGFRRQPAGSHRSDSITAAAGGTPVIENIGLTSIQGVPNMTAAALENPSGSTGGAKIYGSGAVNPGSPYGASAIAGQVASTIMYRFYLEDLTVSGRTYAQVDALDNAEYTKQVLTAGGRYFGDTFTDPATIP